MSDQVIVSIDNLNPNPGLYLPLSETFPALCRNMGLRLDANDTAIFLRQLTYIVQQTYDIEYPELKARRLIPVDNRPGPGAEYYIWRQFDKRGSAAVVDSYSDDFPNAEVVGKEFASRIRSLGVSYQYSIQDLRRASMAGLPLETRKAETARRVMENLLETIAWTGDPNAQASDATPMRGLANIAEASKGYATCNWIDGSATVDQILKDLNLAQKKIVDDTKGVHLPDTLVLPVATYTALATRARSSTFTEDSVLQYILKQSPWLKSIEFTSFLDTAGKAQDTVTVAPRAILYERSPEVCQLVIPQDFEQLPPQQLNMSFKIPCHMRTGGVVVHYPLAIHYIDGTQG